MFDYSSYQEFERENQGYGTCEGFSELHLSLKLILFKQPLNRTVLDVGWGDLFNPVSFQVESSYFYASGVRPQDRNAALNPRYKTDAINRVSTNYELRTCTERSRSITNYLTEV